MLEETVSVLNDKNIRCVGILGTSGTAKGGHMQRTLENAGIRYILPRSEVQEKIDSVIFDRIKCGKSCRCQCCSKNHRQHIGTGGGSESLGMYGIIHVKYELSFRRKIYRYDGYTCKKCCKKMWKKSQRIAYVEVKE